MADQASPSPVSAPPAPQSAAMPTPPIVVDPATPGACQGIWNDIHVNASGLVLFACLVVGIIWPELKPKTDQIAAAAATYLFASSKAGNGNGNGKH